MRDVAAIDRSFKDEFLGIQRKQVVSCDKLCNLRRGEYSAFDEYFCNKLGAEIMGFSFDRGIEKDSEQSKHIVAVRILLKNESFNTI